MDFIRFAINNPVKVTVGVLLLILFGLISLFAIPVQLVPNVDQPVITVATNWTGRSPQEVEKEIVEPQEDKLKGVSSLRKMKAEASQGKAEIELEFFIGTDMTRALLEVSDKLREVPEYPNDVDEPVVSVADGASENAIAWMVLTSDDPEFDIESLRDVVEDRIKPFLERVDGLSKVNVYGGRDREIHIRINPVRLAERGITFDQLRAAVQLENVNISAGDLRDGYRDVRIRTVGQYETLEQIGQTIVADTDGGPVRVSDLGDVVETLAKRRSFVRSRGRPAIALNAIREAGSNVLTVMNGTRDGKQLGLRQRIAQVNGQLLTTLVPDRKLELVQVYDETIYIYDAVRLVLWNLLIGGSLAVVALVLFLRIIRPTLIVALAIPISVVGTFVVMTVAGRNLNVISLAGLAFSVGIVVDNAIVVLENIDRHLGFGKKPLVAAYDATREVWGAILASTLTTLAVFVPVLTIEEEAGQLFRDIALAICAAVLLSLVVAVTVIPSASARWLRHRSQTGRGDRTRHRSGLADLLGRSTVWYAGVIHRLTDRTAPMVVARVLIVLLLTAVAIGGAAALMPPVSYLPNGNRNLTFGVMLTPPAYHIDHNQTIAHRVEQQLRPYWNAASAAESAALPPAAVMVGPGRFKMVDCPPIENYFFVSFGGTIFMGASSRDKQVVSPLSGLLTAAMNEVPGAIGFAFQPSIFGRGVGGGNAVDVEVTGPDVDRVRKSAEALYQQLGRRYGFHRIRPDPINYNMAGPELRIQIDRGRAAALGIDTARLGLTLQALIDGAVIGDFWLAGESIDILLTRHPQYPLTADTIGMVPVAYQTRDGRKGVTSLLAVTKIMPSDAPQAIRRIEERRAVSFTVRLPDDVPLEQATNEIEATVASLKPKEILPGVDAVPAGTADKLIEVRRAMLGQWDGWSLESLRNLGLSRLFLAMLVTYLLMAALFESFLLPLVIMFTIPLATVGGFLGLWIVHGVTSINPLVATQQLDVLTMLGFVILIGVVVNNAILVVHQALNFMRGVGETEADHSEPMPCREAICLSVRTRIRPVCMTTATSAFGMLPLVLMPGAGSELYRGLGSVVVGGLVVATLFTLVVVPLLLSLALDLKATVASRESGWLRRA